MKKLLTPIKKSILLGVDVIPTQQRTLYRRNISDFCYLLDNDYLDETPLTVLVRGQFAVYKTFTKPNYAKLSAQKIAQKKFALESENKDKFKENYTNYSLSKKIPFVKGKITDSCFKQQTRDLTQKEFEILQELVEINQGNIPKSWEQFYLLTDTNFFTFNQTYKKY